MKTSTANSQEGIYVYAAILDVLGYRMRLAQDRESGTPHFKTLLQNALNVLSQINEAECGVQVISDTIFLTWAEQSTFAQFLEVNKKLFVAFLEQGLFLRGGITYSQHFKSGAVTYSYAFSTAYDLESQKAIYPRIVINENIILMFQNPDSGLDLSSLVNEKRIVTSNGTYFLNLIDSQVNWDILHMHAAKLFQSDQSILLKDESAFAKHVWFENYLFHSNFSKDKVRYIPRPQLLGKEKA